MSLLPVPQLADAELRVGQKVLVRDAAWASLSGSLSGGVVLVAFALALGAGPLTIGLLAAIPFMAQVAQLYGISLIERLRQRKKIAVISVTASRALLLVLAAVPLVADKSVAIGLLVAVQIAVALLGSLCGCAVNSWLHQLIPRNDLGPFFSRSLLWGTLLGSAGALLAGLFVEQTADGSRLLAFAAVFAASALAGFVSSWYLARAPEPEMPRTEAREPLYVALRKPLADRNFRSLLVFIGAWTAASNIAAPFLTVYLLRQLGYGLATVTALGVTSQLANAFALHLWGRLNAAIPNKSILAVALPVYFLCTVCLVFADQPAHPWLSLAIFYALHIVMGAATGGIGLATGNLGLTLAPQGQGTAYLAMVGLVAALAGGTAPLLAGAMAQWLQDRELTFFVRWTAPAHTSDLAVFAFAHWEFLFALSAIAGLYVMHALSRVREDGEVSERYVMQQFAIEAVRTVNSLSSIGGALGGLFPFRRIRMRRRRRLLVEARQARLGSRGR